MTRLSKTAWWAIAFIAVYALLVVGSCTPVFAEPTWDGLTLRELVSKYNCEWVKEERKIYTDDELRQKAKDLHLPDVVIRMAERCPR